MSIQIPKEFSYDDSLPVIVPENYVYEGPLHKDKDGIIVIDTEFKGKTLLYFGRVFEVIEYNHSYRIEKTLLVCI